MSAETVQLSIRVPESLRRALKRKAADEGTSVQALVAETLRTALGQPGPDDVDERIGDLVVELLRSGAYAEAAREIGEEDPDLATM